MKKLFLLALLSISLFASSIKVGDNFPAISYKDQFDTSHVLKASTKVLIIAFTRDGGNIVKDALTPKGDGFLESINALYLADISGMPSIISSFFAIPKMKKYPFKILLEKDNSLQDKYPYSEDKVTIIKLNNQKVESIEYIATKDELLEKLK
jgi:hypothetical protein